MKHEPAMNLPPDDAPWWATVDEYRRQVDGLLRARNWDAAERLATEFFERASDAYEAAVYSSSRATILSFLGREDAALKADELAERLVPVEPYFKINIAQRLIGNLGRPAEGLSKLAEAEALMEPSARTGLLGERAVGLLALDRDAEALDCFRQIANPERLARMRLWDYVGLVDFRLVDAFLKKRLAVDLCIAYLEAAEAIAERHNPDRLSDVRGLLARAREAAA